MKTTVISSNSKFIVVDKDGNKRSLYDDEYKVVKNNEVEQITRYQYSIGYGEPNFFDSSFVAPHLFNRTYYNYKGDEVTDTDIKSDPWSDVLIEYGPFSGITPTGYYAYFSNDEKERYNLQFEGNVYNGDPKVILTDEQYKNYQWKARTYSLIGDPSDRKTDFYEVTVSDEDKLFVKDSRLEDYCYYIRVL